jgi:arginine exporter protein ArgO
VLFIVFDLELHLSLLLLAQATYLASVIVCLHGQLQQTVPICKVCALCDFLVSICCVGVSCSAATAVRSVLEPAVAVESAAFVGLGTAAMLREQPGAHCSGWPALQDNQAECE